MNCSKNIRTFCPVSTEVLVWFKLPIFSFCLAVFRFNKPPAKNYSRRVLKTYELFYLHRPKVISYHIYEC